jgi:hypothetical protein
MGLFRHYWIIVKLVINFLSTAILLIHICPIGYMAHLAVQGTITSAAQSAQIQLVAAAAGLLALLVTTGLAVYKPRGMTAYGWRKQYAKRTKAEMLAQGFRKKHGGFGVTQKHLFL